MGVEIVVPVAFFATIFGILYIAITARNKERLALIEKGQDSSIFKSSNDTHYRYVALKLGILAISIGLGLIVANTLDINNVLDDDVAYPSMIAIFGGLGLIIYYLIINRIKPEKES